MTDISGLPAASCPNCGRGVQATYTCHTWPRSRDDGTVQMMSCLPCDSAVRYSCADIYDETTGVDDEGCGWDYTEGLNPQNPRAADNDTRRPAWLDGFDSRTRFGLRVYPGVECY